MELLLLLKSREIATMRPHIRTLTILSAKGGGYIISEALVKVTTRSRAAKSAYSLSRATERGIRARHQHTHDDMHGVPLTLQKAHAYIYICAHIMCYVKHAHINPRVRVICLTAPLLQRAQPSSLHSSPPPSPPPHHMCSIAAFNTRGGRF